MTIPPLRRRDYERYQRERPADPPVVEAPPRRARYRWADPDPDDAGAVLLELETEPTCSLRHAAPPWMWTWAPVVPFSDMLVVDQWLGPDYVQHRGPRRRDRLATPGKAV